ncbi:MAG: inorganic phosphate transporter [Magnetococcales bacterium]|nr:inorganic phosphate transporter [Magnetococcales bacterium]
MEIIAEHGTLLLILAAVFGAFMCWGIGANDVANAMGTSVGSGAITVRQAILIAGVFELAGVILAGAQVTKTIRKGIIDPGLVADQPEILAYGMIAALLASAIWLLIATAKGWPVSTSHTIVGAIVGFAIAGIGMEAVHWNVIGNIAASWLVSPFLGGLFAFLLMHSIRYLILMTDDPYKNALKWAPVYLFLVGWIITLISLFKGLKHLKLDINFQDSMIIAALVGLAVAIIGRIMIARLKFDEEEAKKSRFYKVEQSFIPMMIFTACAMAFAHGSNDVANGIGPLSAVYSIVTSGGAVAQKASVPVWILVMGGVGILIGLATLGYKVMQTIGHKITKLTPTRGFSATLAAAITVVMASSTGLPVSTTHIAVGSVMGVGLARSVESIDLRVVGNIVLSWLITLPTGAVLAIIIFHALKASFG